MDDIHDNIDSLIWTHPLLLSNTRLPNRDVATAASEWESLRSQHPPKCSEFAPLASAAANSDDYDIAFSQAATMTAYAIELLQDAADSLKGDMRCIQQASDFLVTLCDTLIETRDEHRDRRARASEQAPERSHGGQNEDTGSHRSGGRVESSGSGLNRRWHPYLRDRSLLAASREKSARSTAPECAVSHAASECLRAVDSISTECTDDDSDIDTKTRGLAIRPNEALSLLPEELDRRQVIRATFLRQGFTESDIAAFVDCISKKTNVTYDRFWKAWATWCVERDLDPTQRSEADLKICMAERGTSANSSNIKTVVRKVWSIVGASRQELAAILNQDPIPVLPEELSRRQVIRAAFLRQGFTESDIAAYLESVSKKTNMTYDSYWKPWAT
ncbi:hypothetical protein IWW38_001873, partial [Coemansia aciculifera]